MRHKEFQTITFFDVFLNSDRPPISPLDPISEIPTKPDNSHQKFHSRLGCCEVRTKETAVELPGLRVRACASGVTRNQSVAISRCRQRPSNQILIYMEGNCHIIPIAEQIQSRGWKSS